MRHIAVDPYWIIILILFESKGATGDLEAHYWVL